VSVQEDLPAEETATGLAVVNLFMNLGSAVAVSVAQSVFHSYLPGLLRRHAPGVDPAAVLGAGATSVRGLVPPAQLPGLLVAYNEGLTLMFVSFSFFPIFSCFLFRFSRLTCALA
jgi:hypothetical protein